MEIVKRAKNAFQGIKKIITAELILKIYTPSLPTVVKTNVLDFALGVYLV